MIKKTIFAILRYVGAIIGACVLAGVTAVPFLKSGDFSVPIQMIFMAAVSGFYIVTFAALVILAEVFIRRISRHYLLPIWSIPVFGGCFPVIGFVLFPRTWWPEEPADMDARHIAAFLALAVFSLAVVAIVIKLRNRQSANNLSDGRQ
jgi:hypothetical protein